MKKSILLIGFLILLWGGSQHLLANYPDKSDKYFGMTCDFIFSQQLCPSLLNYNVTFHVTGMGYDLEGAWVTLGLVPLQTNAEGIAVFSLPDGDYTYTVTKYGFADEEGTFTVAGEPQLIEVEMEECWDVFLHLVGPYGAITDSALVIVNNDTVWTTNGNAAFCTTEPTINFEVYVEGYYPSIGSIILPEPGMTIGIVMAPISYSITFFVNCCGEPLEGIMLTMGTTTLVTGPDGLAIFNLEEGDYTVEINGYIFNFSVPETSYVDADICSEVLFSVSSGGNPVEEASITINNEIFVTNALGIAEYCVTPGLYQYSIEKVGYLPKDGSVTVTTEPAMVEAHLECELTFFVNCNYNPVEGAMITCNDIIQYTPANGTVFYELENGIYHWEVYHPDMFTTDGDVIINGSPEYIYINPCTGVNDVKNCTVSVNPNPSSGTFTIENLNPTGEPTEIFVTDITGRIVYQTVTSNLDKTEIDLSEQPKGMYFLNIKSGDFVFNEKLIIQ